MCISMYVCCGGCGGGLVCVILSLCVRRFDFVCVLIVVDV